MKAEIHPQYGSVLFRCASCGTEYLVGSTKLDGALKEYQGEEFPSIALEICSQCHPFFSGKQMFIDTAGRVEKFHRRYGTSTGRKDAKAEAAKGEPAEPATAAPTAKK